MKRTRSSGATGATIYQIVVRGELSKRYLPAFEGMHLAAGDGRTAITGPVVDQAQLHGLLNRAATSTSSSSASTPPSNPRRCRSVRQGGS